MKPATPKAWDLLEKLERLAAQGINGERNAAQAKLDSLKSRFDFSGPRLTTADLFAGCFYHSTVAQPILSYTMEDADIVNAVKWAVESTTGIQCVFRDGVLMAEASPASAAKLEKIAGTVSDSFHSLWKRLHQAGANPSDRSNFFLGLYDGMMHEDRHDQALPKRASFMKVGRTKKKALNHAPGLSLHPYSVAVGLGKQIRFNVSLDKIAGELEQTIQHSLAESNA